MIKLLDESSLVDPLCSPQRTIRTEGLADVPLTDLDTASTGIQKEAEATVLSSLDLVEAEVKKALSLDLTCIPRYMRIHPTRKVVLSPSKVASPKLKLIILLTAERWGYRDSSKTYRDRQRILRAASRMCAYDNGFSSEFSLPTLSRWEDGINSEIS